MSADITAADLFGGNHLVASRSIELARKHRPDVVRHTTAFHAAAFTPRSDGGLTRAERIAVALRIAYHLSDDALVSVYGQSLAPLDRVQDLSNSVKLDAAPRFDRWGAILAHSDRLTTEPASSRPAHINQLSAAGLSSQAIVALSELISYVNYQSRLRAGLTVLGLDAPAAASPPNSMPTTRPMPDFNHGEFEWQPWLAPLDLGSATDEQLQAMKVTPSNRAVGAYTLVLAHDPESLAERSPLYNAIMFGPRGLPRPDRELGAVVASRINGCAYCAAVHAKRFVELAKLPDVMRRLHAEGLEGEPDPRRAAMIHYAAVLTDRPSRLRGADAAPLRSAGLDDAAILDLTCAVAMFAWANRLMLSLGSHAAAGAHM